MRAFTTLGKIGKTQTGGTPSSKHPEYFEGQIPWIGTTALNGEILDEGSAVKLITQNAIDNSATKLVPENSIMVGIRVGVGKAAINAVPMCTSQDIVSIVGIDAATWNKEYVLLSVQAKTKSLAAQAQGATITGISSKTLKEVPVPVRSRAEQDCIVKKLKSIKVVRKATEEIRLHLDELVKSRFIEMFGDPVLNPYGWPREKLSALGELKNGVNFKAVDSGHEIRCLGVGDFKNRSRINDIRLISKVQLNCEPSISQMLQDGDIVFVRSNGNKQLVGRCLAVFPGAERVTFSGFCIRFRLVTDALETGYLLEAFKADSMRQATIGRGANIQNISQKILANIELPIPPRGLQLEYAAFTKQVDKLKFETQQSIDKLQMLYDSLAQEYFGG